MNIKRRHVDNEIYDYESDALIACYVVADKLCALDYTNTIIDEFIEELADVKWNG